MKLLTILSALVLSFLVTLAFAGCTKTPPPAPAPRAPATSTATKAELCDCVVNPVSKELNECECGKTEDSPPPTSPPSFVKKPDCKSVLKGVNLTGCPLQGQYQMIDAAQPLDRKFLEVMACLDVKAIGRYYDWPGQETIKGKIPTDAEVAILNELGFERLHVLQHNNNKLTTFTAERGKIDAGKALGLASKWGQPKGSAVYFGVDGDFPPEKPLEYFKAAAPIVRAAGYRVGMYGSGGTCEALKKAKLVDGDLCWIAASSWGWRGTKDILAKNKGFALKQKVNQKCMGKSLDYNTAMLADYGQWRKQ